MAKAVTFINYCFIGFLLYGSLVFIGNPVAPKKLPDDVNFLAQVERPGIVVVKFGAEWCPPCRAAEKDLEELSRSGSPNFSLVKIDIDHHQELASHYGVSSIPHLLLFKDGKQVAETRGYGGHENLKRWIASAR